MRICSALFFLVLFFASIITRLHAPDGINEASSPVYQGKSVLWESENTVTKPEESNLLTSGDDSSTSSQIISISSSSSSSEWETSSSAPELEELMTPTVAPATPSYDSDTPYPSITNAASSSRSHAQASIHVPSSVILIPPRNPAQVQSSKGSQNIKVDERNNNSESLQSTKEPEVLSSVLDSVPSSPISSKSNGTPPSASITKEEDSITAALKQAEEESKPKEEEMPSFDEFKRRVLQEEKKKSKQQNAESASGAAQKPKKVKERKQSNYASVDCGAKILDHNTEASNAESILVENKDLYMLNPCSAQVWFVVELCDVAQVKSIQIANFELFSSTPESFRVYVSKRYPTREWTMLGTFQAREEREIQTFPLDEPIYAKYFKVDMLSHFGSEHYCPLSLLRVYGSSMMEELEDHETEGHEDNDSADSDNDVPVIPAQPGAKMDEEPKKPNLLERAADTVISLVKKFTGNGHDEESGAVVGEGADDKADILESIHAETSVHSGLQDVNKGKLVTHVGHEDLKENPQESTVSISTEKQDLVNERNASQTEKSKSVNFSEEHSSSCKEEHDLDESSTTSLALSSCQLFSQVIGKYCLGCFMGRLLFSKRKDVTVSFHVSRIRNISMLNNTSTTSSTLDESGFLENEEGSPKESIQKKPLDFGSLENQGTLSDAANLKFSVNTPEPSSSNVELKKESTVLYQVESAEILVPSSRSVQPSHSDNLQKREFVDEKTPALEDVSLVTSTPLNSTQSASVTLMLQSSELPQFTESSTDTLEGNNIAGSQHGIIEQPLQQSSPSSQAIVSDGHHVPVTEDSAQQSEVPSELKDVTSENGEQREGKTSDLKIREGTEEHKPQVSSSEYGVSNSIHMMSQSSPDIDVLETKLTDKDGREGTAQLPQELHIKVEEDPFKGIKEASIVANSSDANVDPADSASNETLPSESKHQESVGEKEVPSSATVESHTVDSTILPTLPPSVDTPDLSDSVVPIPAPPVTADTNLGSLDFATAASESNLDSTVLSKAHQAGSISASMASMAGSGLHKESIFVRLSNKIKALEQNLNMSTLYMEQLHQRYRKSLDELQKNSDKKVALLTNATKKAESVINNQKEQISQLQSKLDNVTNLVADMSARMGHLKKEVVERHVIGLCIEIILILVLFIVLSRRRSNQVRSTEHFMNGHGPPTLTIEDTNHNKDNKIDPTILLSGRDQLLRSFGDTPAAETIGSSTVTDSFDNKLHKGDSLNLNESKKKRNRKRKASNTPETLPDSSVFERSNKPEPFPDSHRNSDTPSPASFVSRTAGLLFFGARGFFGGFKNPWKQKKPCTVHSDPNIATSSESNQVYKAPVGLNNSGITRARSLDLIPEETGLHKHGPPTTHPLPSEIGVMFKRPPDCYYSKRGNVKNVTPSTLKFGKYGVLDPQLA